jgi:hypothetical protein
MTMSNKEVQYDQSTVWLEIPTCYTLLYLIKRPTIKLADFAINSNWLKFR